MVIIISMTALPLIQEGFFRNDDKQSWVCCFRLTDASCSRDMFSFKEANQAYRPPLSSDADRVEGTNKTPRTLLSFCVLQKTVEQFLPFKCYIQLYAKLQVALEKTAHLGNFGNKINNKMAAQFFKMFDVISNAKNNAILPFTCALHSLKVVLFLFKCAFSNNQAAVNTTLNNQKRSKLTVNSVYTINAGNQEKVFNEF